MQVPSVHQTTHFSFFVVNLRFILRFLPMSVAVKLFLEYSHDFFPFLERQKAHSKCVRFYPRN